jgi:hypothetical protein
LAASAYWADQPGAAEDSTQESVLPQAVDPATTSAADAKASTRRSTGVLSVVERVVQARLSEPGAPLA